MKVCWWSTLLAFARWIKAVVSTRFVIIKYSIANSIYFYCIYTIDRSAFISGRAEMLANYFTVIRTQQKPVLLKLEEFTLEIRGNIVSLGQEYVFLDVSNNTLVIRRNSLKVRA